MFVKQVINNVFASNTFILSKEGHNWVRLIDIGEIEEVLKSLSKDTLVKGVFITHPHFDHIYGINRLIEFFPECITYTSEEGKKGLLSEKLNLSFYHEDPIIFAGSNIQILHETDKIDLFDDCLLETFETPGHNLGCLTFKTENFLFTGDSFIPDVAVVTKLKGRNREASMNSLRKIMKIISENTIICPGHGVMTQIQQSDLILSTQKSLEP